jgi:hypothetical protein
MASREPWFESRVGARLRFGLRFKAHPRKASCREPCSESWVGVRRDKTSTSASALTPDHENGSEPVCQAVLLSKGLTSMSKTRHANAVAEVRTNAGVVVKPRG